MSKRKRLLTVEDLVKFCEEKNLTDFNAKKVGHPIHIQIPSTFSIDSSSDDGNILYGNIKLLHTGRNRNHSNVTEKAAKHCMSTLAYKPLLANFTDVNGEWDFTSHDFYKVEGEDGEEEIVYVEKQVGCFTADEPYMEYDDEHGHDYIYARVAIPRGYTKAADIIERKNGTKISAELEIIEMSYSGKDRVLTFDDAVVVGATCLGVDPDSGEELNEGMIDAQISLQSFSNENNTMFSKDILKELRKFNEYFEVIKENVENVENVEEGGKNSVNKELFEQLLKKYEVNEEQISFETDNLSDDELITAFKEAFSVDPTSSNDNGETPVGGGSNGENSNIFSVTLPSGEIKNFSLSLDEVQNALFNLVNDTYSELDNEIYSTIVYPDDNYVVMCGWFGGGTYRQKYSRKKDNFRLEGDRVSVHQIFVTDDEEKILNEAKANFADVSKKLGEAMEKLDKFESEPEKIETIESEAYNSVRETEEFQEAIKRENYFNLTKDELSDKLDKILLSYAKKVNFSQSNNDDDISITDSKNSSHKIFSYVPFVGKTSPRKTRYGGLFNKK